MAVLLKPENTKIRVFPVFKTRSQQPKSQSAASFRIIDKTDKTDRFEPVWVGVFVKMSEFRHVLLNPEGNTF